ncbi:hypothetical protein PFDG_05047 [Plasmodium falciparum Dd2]|uniref:Uncharacterized protein n=1 Tax=Plasmodium falciparum (isolate Dd2) TaxID=57267 RepID=A0A0L7M9M3_PLAF4|nr:hypothetical protein PFDG_05047 [Plasmodium falciparum Dd2]
MAKVYLVQYYTHCNNEINSVNNVMRIKPEEYNNRNTEFKSFKTPTNINVPIAPHVSLMKRDNLRALHLNADQSINKLSKNEQTTQTDINRNTSRMDNRLEILTNTI